MLVLKVVYLVYHFSGEGTKEVIRNLPFARMWFWKGKMNELTNMIEGELDGPLGFGRY